MAKKQKGKSQSTKEEGVSVEGIVAEPLSNGLFRIQLQNEIMILGHLAGKLRKNNIKVLPADRVTVELSPYDLTRGRITYRYK